MKQTYRFSLPDIRCVNCVRPINNTLNSIHTPTITAFNTDLIDKTLTVTVDDGVHSPEQIRKIIHDELDSIGVECVDIQESGVLSIYRRILRSHIPLGVLGTSSGLLLLIGSVFTAGLPLFFTALLAGASVLLTLFLGAESYMEAWTKLVKARTLTMDTLFAISTLTVLAVSIASFFVPGLPQMFDAGLLIFGFRHIGQAIEASIKQSMGLKGRFKDRLPEKVWVLTSEKPREEKALSDIQAGDVIELSAGDIIPVNGVCETGDNFIFDTILTGAVSPRKAISGELLLAGMTVADGSKPLRLNVSATAMDSHLARLDNQIAEAETEKAALETFTDKVLQYFIPSVIVLAVLSGVIVNYYFSPILAIQCVAAVLVSACPCTLGFITPLAVKIGLNKAAEHGVQFKSAKSLQEAEQIDTVVFDLNGTLTSGVLSVRHHQVLPDSGISADELLRYFALLEKNASHPVAHVIRDFVAEKRVGSGVDLSETAWERSEHCGLQAKIDDHVYTLGNFDMMKRDDIDFRGGEPPEVRAGESVVYLARNKRVIGYLVIHDPIRPNAQQAVQSLKALGKDVYICTGADEATAHRYAALLGVSPENVQAACVGSEDEHHRDKKSYISDLKAQGRRVAMVGDAANDAVAIAASDFGIAVKSELGDEMTQQEAGALLQSGSFLPIVSAFAVAKDTVSNIKQNLLMSMGYNFVTVLVAGSLPLALGISLNPAVAAGLMILQSSLILLNAVRFKQQKLPHLQQESERFTTDSSYRQLQASFPPGPECGLEHGKSQDSMLDIHQKASVLFEKTAVPGQKEPTLHRLSAKC